MNASEHDMYVLASRRTGRYQFYIARPPPPLQGYDGKVPHWKEVVCRHRDSNPGPFACEASVLAKSHHGPTLLDEYQAKFMPASATKMARMNFAQARQTESENILEWHGRARATFLQACPDRAATADIDCFLIDKFALGLKDASTMNEVWRRAPATYAAALEAAHDQHSGDQALRAHNHGAMQSRVKKEGLHAMGPSDGRRRPMACWICESLEHVKLDCPKRRGKPESKRDAEARPKSKTRPKTKSKEKKRIAAVANESDNGDELSGGESDLGN
jgi:hypothetical protein